MTLFVCCWTDESGQDLIEYGLLAALISVFAVSAIAALGITLNEYYDTNVVGQFP